MKNSKVVNVVFAAAAGLVWFLLLHYLAIWSGSFQLARRVGAGGADAIRQGVPLILGIATFVILRTNTKATYFVSDSLDELFRVVFPGPREVKIGTAWVITLVILAGIIFGALDWGINSIIKSLIGIRT
jgi:preprotein translocase SecE subunit